MGIGAGIRPAATGDVGGARPPLVRGPPPRGGARRVDRRVALGDRGLRPCRRPAPGRARGRPLGGASRTPRTRPASTGRRARGSRPRPRTTPARAPSRGALADGARRGRRGRRPDRRRAAPLEARLQPVDRGRQPGLARRAPRAVGLVPPEPPTVERAGSSAGSRRRSCRPATTASRASSARRRSRRFERRDRTTARRACSTCSASTSSGWATSTPGSTTSGSPSRLARETGAVDSQLGLAAQPRFFLGQTDRFEEGLRVAFGRARDRARASASSGATAPGLRASAGDILHRAGPLGRGRRGDRGPGSSFDEDISGWIYLQATRALFLAARGERRPRRGGDRGAPASSPARDIDADVRAYLLGATAEAAVLDDRPADALRAVEDGARRVRRQRRAAPARAAPRGRR